MKKNKCIYKDWQCCYWIPGRPTATSATNLWCVLPHPPKLTSIEHCSLQCIVHYVAFFTTVHFALHSNTLRIACVLPHTPKLTSTVHYSLHYILHYRAFCIIEHFALQYHSMKSMSPTLPSLTDQLCAFSITVHFAEHFGLLCAQYKICIMLKLSVFPNLDCSAQFIGWYSAYCISFHYTAMHSKGIMCVSVCRGVASQWMDCSAV